MKSVVEIKPCLEFFWIDSKKHVTADLSHGFPILLMEDVETVIAHFATYNGFYTSRYLRLQKQNSLHDWKQQKQRK
jgi:hypothetical protein